MELNFFGIGSAFNTEVRKYASVHIDYKLFKKV